MCAGLLVTGIIGMVGATTNNPAHGENLSNRATQECGHPWDRDTYRFFYIDNEHHWCTSICGYCGMNRGSSEESHTFTTRTTPATCTQSGKVETYCQDCLWVKTTTPTNALGHDYKVTVAQYTPPTCTASGKQVFTSKCSRCADTKTTTTTYPALSHDYWVEVTNIPATCTTAGKIVNRCARCDETQTAILPALGHRYGEWTMTGQTADNQRVESRTCTVCQDTEERTVKSGSHCHQITLTGGVNDNNLVLKATIWTDQAMPFSTLQALLNYLNSLVNFDYLVCTGSVRYYDPYNNRWATGEVIRFAGYGGQMFTYYYTKSDVATIPKHTTVTALTIADEVVYV